MADILPVFSLLQVFCIFGTAAGATIIQNQELSRPAGEFTTSVDGSA